MFCKMMETSGRTQYKAKATFSLMLSFLSAMTKTNAVPSIANWYIWASIMVFALV